MNAEYQPQLIDRPPDTQADARRAVFDTALMQYRHELLSYLRSRVHDEEVAADLVQDTYSRMLKYRDDPQIGDARLMLFRIANNLVTDFVRYQHCHHASDHIPLEDAGPIPASESSQEERVVAVQAMAAIKRAVSELPPKCRLVFILSRFDGMTNAQVASRLDISVKMVEKHMARALLACRAAVGLRNP